jgi:hypothetical protein
MKIRIKGNSLRFRLTRVDLLSLTETGYVEDKIDFIGKSLFYGLEIKSDGDLSVTFSNNAITLFMPEFMMQDWENEDRIGFESHDGKVHLLVEKDFTCLDKVNEDQSNNYPNPLAEKLYA